MDAEGRLRAATTLALVEALALAALVLARDGTTRLLLVAALVVKVPFCVLARRRHPGGWFALLLWEGFAAFVALVGPRIALPLRAAEVAVAGTVVVLLLRAASVFPEPRLPERP